MAFGARGFFIFLNTALSISLCSYYFVQVIVSLLQQLYFAGGLSQQLVYIPFLLLAPQICSYFFHLFPELRVGSPSVVVDPSLPRELCSRCKQQVGCWQSSDKKTERNLCSRVGRTQPASVVLFWFPGGQADVNIPLGQKDSGRVPSISESVSYSLSQALHQPCSSRLQQNLRFPCIQLLGSVNRLS